MLTDQQEKDKTLILKNLSKQDKEALMALHKITRKTFYNRINKMKETDSLITDCLKLIKSRKKSYDKLSADVI